MRILFTLSLSLLIASPLLAQRGGGERGPGGGGGMRGGMNPDDSFNRLLQSYGGTGDTVDYSRVSPESRERYNRFAQMSGSEPMPTSGFISRAQYTEAYNKRMEAFRGGGGGGGMFNRGGGGPGGNNTPFGGQPQQPGVAMTVRTVEGQPGSTMTIQPPPPPGERPVDEGDLQKMITKYDRDGDHRISLEEAQRTDRLKNVFAYYDANKDGFIDGTEMRVYFADRANNRVPESNGGNNWGGGGGGNWGGGGGGNWGGGGWGGGERGGNPPPPEEEKPVALRFGKLPLKELPSWWERLDTDKDGQIGMYEWRADKRAMPEFLTMDLNADGYITAEEYLRFKKAPMATSTDSKSESSYNAFRSNGKEGNSRGGDSKSREERGDMRGKGKDERGNGGGGNPFRRP